MLIFPIVSPLSLDSPCLPSQGATSFLELLRQPCRGMMARPAPADLGAAEWQRVIERLESEGAEDPRGTLRDAGMISWENGWGNRWEKVEGESWEIHSWNGGLWMGFNMITPNMLRCWIVLSMIWPLFPMDPLMGNPLFGELLWKRICFMFLQGVP